MVNALYSQRSPDRAELAERNPGFSPETGGKSLIVKNGDQVFVRPGN